MKRYLTLLLAAFVFFSGGCAVKDSGAPTVQQVETKRDQLTELSSSKTVSIAEHPYLGAKPIIRQTDNVDIPVLNTSVTLKQQGTLSEIAASLSTIAPLSAQVSDTDADDPQPTKQSSSPELPALDDLGGSTYPIPALCAACSIPSQACRVMAGTMTPRRIESPLVPCRCAHTQSWPRRA